jgi:isopentenyl phosphate kinase
VGDLSRLGRQTRVFGLNSIKPTILKIGGSAITVKEGELAARTQEIDRLAGEIQGAAVQNLVVVHGGGSFGHPSAEEYAIKEGYKQESQKAGFSVTHHYMTVLNGLFMDSLIWHSMAAVSVTPSSCIITEDGRIKQFDDSSVRTLLKMGFTPVLYGDVVLDTKLGFTVLSGDQLVSALALRLDAGHIIIGVDVDGVYDADPKLVKTARMLDHLTLRELKSLQDNLGKATACDVTGGMFGKMAELMPAIEMNIPVTVVNATKPSYVYKALQREAVRGTLIERE